MRFCMLLIPLLCLCAFQRASADKGSIINPITDVCWDCLFPITVSGVNVTPGYKDLSSTKERFCICAGLPPKVGVPLTFWEPLYLVEVTRHPYKLVGMGGISVGPDTVKNRGSIGIQGDGPSEHSFYHVHWYEFPLMHVLGLLEDFACIEEKDPEIPYMSELDPTWNNDRLSLILNPEAALFASPIAQVPCIADCLSSSAGKPLDALFWCAGCEGSLYPFTGTVAHHVGSLQASSLLVHRACAKLHRSGLVKGYADKEFCEAQYMPIIKKSRYKTQLAYPKPQSSPCNPLGKSDLLWKRKVTMRTDDEDYAYILWTKRHCCLDANRFVEGGKKLRGKKA
ncbi:MAG: TraU family protein [Candidatus Obscuribacterales bacterium]